MQTVLGFDAGGTGTRAIWVREDGHVLGLGKAGPGNVQNRGLPAALAEMRLAAAAARPPDAEAAAPSAAFAACAGIKAAGDARTVTSALAAAGIADEAAWTAANDTEAVLAAGLGGAPGIVIIAGTGSFCFGRDSAGRTASCGGWGWLIDEIGSAFYFGREALRAVVYASDGRGPPTALTPGVMTALGIDEPDGLLGKLTGNDAPVPLVASLAPVLTSCAREGDEIACTILSGGAEGLAEMVRPVAARLTWQEPPAIVISGSTARSGPPYQPLVEAAIKRAVPGCRVVEASLPPVAGAALRALEAAGFTATPERLAELRRGCARLGLLS